MERTVLWCRSELLLEGQPSRVGVRVRLRSVAPERVGLSERAPPLCAVVIERARREPQQEPLLGLVQHPNEVAGGHERDERGGVHLLGGRPEYRLRTGQVALRQRHHHPCTAHSRFAGASWSA